MIITGLVEAKDKEQALGILQDLQDEFVLDYYDMEHDSYVSDAATIDEAYYDAYVNPEGYLTLERDMPDFIARLAPNSLDDYHLFGFVAEYNEA